MGREETWILVVDDEYGIRETLGEIVEVLGFKHATASSGEEAMALIDEAPSKFSVVLTDMKMPGMDGMELIKRIKEKYPEIDVISITGYSSDYSFTDVVDAGASDFILKPFKLNELEAKLKRVLRERGLLRELREKEKRLDAALRELQELKKRADKFKR